MPYCPECGYEYLPDITKCPDCDRELVDSLPVEKHLPDENWLPLRNLPGNIYAEMVKEVLDKAGIPSMIKSDAISTAYGAKTASVAGSAAQIFVPEKYHKQCQQILFDMMDHI